MARRKTPVPRPARVRTLAGAPFGWLHAHLLRQGWLRALTPDATAAYAFLCLAADRQGVSFYRRERIARELGLADDVLHRALSRLEELDLVAYQPFRSGAADGFRQVLSLPSGPAPLGLPALVIEQARRIGRPLRCSPDRHP